MSHRARSVHDALLYVGKVWLAGLAAAVLIPMVLVAALLDVLGRDDRLVRRVLLASARLEVALDVHGPLTRIEIVEEDA
ncbi:MAG: hypothetical protein AAGI52_16380 [Bacteroidota bacterium]